MIPEAAIEAAARAFFGTLAMSKWEDLGPVTREAYCDKSRAALEAAAPHMLNLAKREAWDANVEIQRLRAELAKVRPDFRESNLKVILDELAKPLFPLGKVEDKRRHGND